MSPEKGSTHFHIGTDKLKGSNQNEVFLVLHFNHHCEPLPYNIVVVFKTLHKSFRCMFIIEISHYNQYKVETDLNWMFFRSILLCMLCMNDSILKLRLLTFVHHKGFFGNNLCSEHPKTSLAK